MAVWEKSEALPTSSDWLNQALKIGLSPFRVNEGSDYFSCSLPMMTMNSF